MSDATPRLITVEDLLRLPILDDPRWSPDGRWIAYVQATPNPLERGATSAIFLASPQGGAPVQLTRGGKDSQPRWSPDGQWLAFTSARGGVPQIYLLPIGQPGEARALTSHAHGATSPAWSPDGQRIAYLANGNAADWEAEDSGTTPPPPLDKLEAQYRKDRLAEDKKAYFDPQVVDKIPFRLGTSLLDDRTAQLYLIEAHAEQPKPRRLTSWPTPHSEPHWSADGRALYTVRSYRPQADEFWRDGNITRIDAESAEATRLADDVYTIYDLRPSPDGRWLAYSRRLKDAVDHLVELALLPLGEDGLPSDAAFPLNRSLDRNLTHYVWTPDNHLETIAQMEGRYALYRFSTDASAPRLRLEGEGLEGLDVGPQGDIAFSQTTVAGFNELALLEAGTGQARQLSQAQTLLRELKLAQAQRFTWDNGAGHSIEGWYFLPPHAPQDQPLPTIINMHGGPHILWTPADRGMWHEFQLQAAQGYLVFFCNPRGSLGYGEAFSRAVHRHWGDYAMQDVMGGIDALVARGLADPERLYLTGGSYAGYLTAWMVAHSTRFRAAVAHRGVYNLISFHGTSDIPSFVRAEFGVEPWEDPDFLWQQSPLAHAHRIKTPLLIQHAEGDYRVPIEQGEQLFTWVRRSGGTVKLLRFPRDGHDMTRVGEPAHRMDSLRATLAWFEQFGGPSQAQA